MPTFQNSCIILQSCSSFFFCLHGQPELFASDHLLQFLFNSLRCCFSWFSIFSFSRLILSLSLICSSVSETLFALGFSFLSEHFFLVHAKAALALAYSPRDSAYAVNLTYRLTYHPKSRLNTLVWGSLRSPNYIFMIKNHKNFPFLDVCRIGLPALSWTQKCECRLEIRCSVLVSVCIWYTRLSQDK